MNMSSVMGGGFRGAAAPNSFTGVFPMGARVPTRPNPLAQPGKAVQGKADVAGIQAAQAKRASEDRRKVKYDNETGLTGQAAIDTLPKYMKSAGLNDFQANFLSRLVRAGMDEAQIRNCIKQAGDEFGADIAKELNAGIDKLAGIGAGIGSGLKAIGGGLKSLPGKAVAAGKALGGKATQAAKALPGKAKSVAKATPGAAWKATKAVPGAAGKAVVPGAAVATPLIVDSQMRQGRADLSDQMNQMMYGSQGEDGTHYPGFADEMAGHVGGIQSAITNQGDQIRSQIGSVTNPLSGLMGGLGKAVDGLGGYASKAKDYLQANPNAAAALLAGGGAGLGGLIGGRKGALVGGAGLPLAYLASQGQFGDLSGKLKGLMGGQGEVDPVAQQQAAQEAAATQAVQSQAAQQQQGAAQQQAPAVESRNELGANQLQ